MVGSRVLGRVLLIVCIVLAVIVGILLFLETTDILWKSAETTQLEKSRDAITNANLRTAYADAAAAYLEGGDNPATAVIEVAGTESNGAEFSVGSAELDAALIPKLDNRNVSGNVTVAFTFGEDNNCVITEYK